MPDTATENYKKAVTRIVDRWSGKVEKIGKDMAPVLAELNELAKDKDADKARVAELRKQMAGFQAQFDKAALELKVDLMLIQPAKDADPKEVKKLPDWMQQIIKKKGVPLGKAVSIGADVDFDFKTFQLKKLVPTITVTFP